MGLVPNAGATTLAVHLAGALADRTGPVVLADVPGTAGTARWTHRRQQEAGPDRFLTATLVPRSLADPAALWPDARLIVLDLARGPASGLLSFLRPDLLLVVMPRQAKVDEGTLRSLSPSRIDRGQRMAMVLTRVGPDDVMPDEGWVSDPRMTVLHTPLRNRMAFALAMARGCVAGEIEPGGRADQDVERLTDAVLDQLAAPSPSDRSRRRKANRKGRPAR